MAYKKIFISLMLTWLFCGCNEGGLQISVRFNDGQGLREGDRVIFEQEEIGRVSGISVAGGEYLTHLVIEKEFSNAATEYSRFFITADPQNEGKKAVEMIQTQEGGSPLKEGATVEGSTKASALIGQASGGLEAGLEGLKKEFERFFDELRTLPESEEYRKLEQELARLSEELKRSGQSAREKIQKELVPKIQKEIDRLREQLRQYGREKELEPIDTQMKEIREI